MAENRALLGDCGRCAGPRNGRAPGEAVTTRTDLRDDLVKPVAPRPERKGALPEERPCDVCHARRLYLVKQTAGPLTGFRLCSECSDKYAAARAAGRVPWPTR